MRKNSIHGEIAAEGSAGGSGVDLGLHALIEGAGKAPEEPLVQKEEADEEVVVGSTKHLVWLRDQGDWNEISILCEERIAAIGPTDVEARAWWVLSQRELGLPFGLLTAPLESLSSDVLTVADLEEDTKTIVVSLITAAVPLLIERGERDLGKVLSERARHLRPNMEGPVPVKPSEASVLPQREKPPERRSGGYVLASILGLSALLSGVAMTRSQSEELSLDTRFHPVYYAPPSPLIQNPHLLPVTEMSHLDAVLYDLDGRSSPKLPSPKALPTTEPRKEEISPVSLKRVKKETVNTEGPLEPAGFLQNVEEPPPLHSQEASPFERGGSPVAIRAEQRQGEKATVHKSARYYTILVRTEVYSGPTRTSPTIAELQKGDHIEVDAEVGEWFKIRSRKGSPGYVLSRDAVVENRTREQYAVRR